MSWLASRYQALLNFKEEWRSHPVRCIGIPMTTSSSRLRGLEENQQTSRQVQLYPPMPMAGVGQQCSRELCVTLMRLGVLSKSNFPTFTQAEGRHLATAGGTAQPFGIPSAAMAPAGEPGPLGPHFLPVMGNMGLYWGTLGGHI